MGPSVEHDEKLAVAGLCLLKDEVNLGTLSFPELRSRANEDAGF